MAGLVKCVGSVIDHTYEASHRRFADSFNTVSQREYSNLADSFCIML